MGDFALVTKFSGRTEPEKKLYSTQLTLMRLYHTEIMTVTNYSDKSADFGEGD